MPASRVWIRRAGTACALARLTALFVVLGLLKPFVPFERLARWAGRRQGSKETAPQDVARAAGRVLRAGRISGFPDRDCFQRSLLLFRELSRLGCAPVLVVGFRREEGSLSAHAWVIAGGRVIGEDARALNAFTPAFTVTAGGSIAAP
jgi:hypothetical protein